ncbi:MAG TPA: hypothetical protein VKY32_05735 [Flavobacterium sp.]|nr:hypothetical protein [Flavobacterium sp.]
MKKWTFIYFLLLSFGVYGQIEPTKNPFPENDFQVYQTYEKAGLHFAIGRFEPEGYSITQTNSTKFTYEPNGENPNPIYKNKVAWIYLKVTNNHHADYFFLDEFYDVDLFQFKELNSKKLLFIKNRYAFYLFDLKDFKISEKQIPGKDQYEGEDAISGLFDALTLFDNEHFLLGNVQGFGVFCFDISNPLQPKELKQFTIKTENKGQFYAFFPQKKHNKFDLLVAQTDAESKNKSIERLYGKLKNIRFEKKNISLKTDSNQHPLIKQSKNILILSTHNGVLPINL